MVGFRVFLVGTTFFAESVTHLLRENGVFDAVERFETIPALMASIRFVPPDVLILADMDIAILQGDMSFFSFYPDIPVICIDSDSIYMKLITTTQITASLSNLIETITTVKKAPAINGREVI